MRTSRQVLHCTYRLCVTSATFLNSKIWSFGRSGKATPLAIYSIFCASIEKAAGCPKQRKLRASAVFGAIHKAKVCLGAGATPSWGFFPTLQRGAFGVLGLGRSKACRGFWVRGVKFQDLGVWFKHPGSQADEQVISGASYGRPYPTSVEVAGVAWLSYRIRAMMGSWFRPILAR